MKSGIRIAAITTGPIGDSRKGKVLLVCVVGNQNSVEGILSCSVEIDGTDSTTKIIKMIKRSRFNDQIKLVAFNGIALAGLNVVDVPEIRKHLPVEVIVVTRKKPRVSLLIRSLKLLAKRDSSSVDKRIRLIEHQAKGILFNGFYVQSYSESKVARIIIERAQELLRLSHLISRGISTGESKGRM